MTSPVGRINHFYVMRLQKFCKQWIWQELPHMRTIVSFIFFIDLSVKLHEMKLWKNIFYRFQFKPTFLSSAWNCNFWQISYKDVNWCKTGLNLFFTGFDKFLLIFEQSLWKFFHMSIFFKTSRHVMQIM